MYWNRALLKGNAKKVLAGSYWQVFLVCLVAGLLSGGLSAVSNLTVNFNMNSSNGMYTDPTQALAAVGGLAVFGGILGMVFAAFVANPILVGLNRYMMENRAGFPPFGSLFSVFQDKAQYLNLVKVMFLYNLEIMLWSLLCVIPGIYKSYQYFYVPYLLAENPYMSYSRAKQLSVAMTQDEKMEIFVLELSFIGWNLLGALLCGIGVLFVAPYMEATFAELYAAARAKAFSLGVTNETELADFTRYNNPPQANL